MVDISEFWQSTLTDDWVISQNITLKLMKSALNICKDHKTLFQAKIRIQLPKDLPSIAETFYGPLLLRKKSLNKIVLEIHLKWTYSSILDPLLKNGIIFPLIERPKDLSHFSQHFYVITLVTKSTQQLSMSLPKT